MESRRAGIDAGAMPCAAIRREVGLERLELGPEDKGGVVDDAGDRLVDFAPDFSGTLLEIDERDFVTHVANLASPFAQVSQL
jgi:hypothetical protein